MSSFRRIIEALQSKGFGGMGDFPASFAGIVECILAAPGGGGGGTTLPDGDTTGQTIAWNGSSWGLGIIPQPLDSDLTDIAGLGTTSFGRSLLTLSNASAARNSIGVTPILSGGTAIEPGSLTGTTTETTLMTVTIPGGTLANPGEHLEIIVSATFVGTAGAKNIRMRLGSISGTIIHNPTIAATHTVHFTLRRITLLDTATLTTQGPLGVLPDNANASASYVTHAFDWTTSQDIVITGQLAVATDTITLRGVSTRIFRN